MSKQNVGVIGLGPIGNKHADIYMGLEHAELVCVCDIDKERADASSSRLGVPAFYSVSDMLDGTELDMVSVATGGEEYGSDHHEPTMQAFKAGLHVLGEKPISNDIPAAEEMVAKAIDNTRDFIRSTYQPIAQVAARGGTLTEAWDACRAECDPKFSQYAIYEHYLPFNVARAFDEARGIDTPRIWTAERDLQMWADLQG